jgi:hypothetical protein
LKYKSILLLLVLIFPNNLIQTKGQTAPILDVEIELVGFEVLKFGDKKSGNFFIEIKKPEIEPNRWPNNRLEQSVNQTYFINSVIYRSNNLGSWTGLEVIGEIRHDIRWGSDQRLVKFNFLVVNEGEQYFDEKEENNLIRVYFHVSISTREVMDSKPKVLGKLERTELILQTDENWKASTTSDITGDWWYPDTDITDWNNVNIDLDINSDEKFIPENHGFGLNNKWIWIDKEGSFGEDFIRIFRSDFILREDQLAFIDLSLLTTLGYIVFINGIIIGGGLNKLDDTSKVSNYDISEVVNVGVNQIVIAVVQISGTHGLLAEISSISISSQLGSYVYLIDESKKTTVLDNKYNIRLGASIRSLINLETPDIFKRSSNDAKLSLVTGRSSFFIEAYFDVPKFDNTLHFLITSKRGLFERYTFDYPLYSLGIIPKLGLLPGLNLSISLVVGLQLSVSTSFETVGATIDREDFTWNEFKSINFRITPDQQIESVQFYLQKIQFGINIEFSLVFSLLGLIEEEIKLSSFSIHMPTTQIKDSVALGGLLVEVEQSNNEQFRNYENSRNQPKWDISNLFPYIIPLLFIFLSIFVIREANKLTSNSHRTMHIKRR